MTPEEVVRRRADIVNYGDSHTGQLFGIDGSGHVVHYERIATYHRVDGRITHEWSKDDIFTLMQTINPHAGAAAPKA